MSQITLYLDDDTRGLLKKAAQASGLSQSRWVAQAIRQHATDTWPPGFLDLAGRFPDFPLREDAPELPPDVPRVGL